MRGRRDVNLWMVGLLLLMMVAAGCRDMHEQPKGDPLESSSMFDDGMLARPLVEGVVPRGMLREDAIFYTGRDGGQWVTTVPTPVTRKLLNRGQERYNIFCSPCHNHTGDGQGMIVLRGLTAPPSFHEERMRTAPDGHIYDVITNGFGRMFPYAQRIPPEDRWAIVAYVRALQLSHNATLDDVPAEIRQQLQQRPQEAIPSPREMMPSQVPAVQERAE